MMPEAKPHEVVILGKKYKLRSSHEAERMAELAAYVTEQVNEVQRRGTVATLDAALLAAVNIADELFQLRREVEERLAAIGEKAQELIAHLEGEDAKSEAPDSKADAG